MIRQSCKKGQVPETTAVYYIQLLVNGEISVK